MLSAELPQGLTASSTVHHLYDELIDFLASGPTPEQIVAFKVSPTVQARLEELLDKNREEGLTDSEAAELEIYEQINSILLLLKARARPAFRAFESL